MSVFDAKTVTLRDGTAVLLRSPTDADAEGLLCYLDRVRRESPFLMFDPADELPTLDAEREWVRKSLENPLSLKILVEAEGGIVGLCDVTAGVGLTRGRHRGEIGISVLSRWCNRGLGTLLMRELIEWARRQDGITVARLSVLADNERARAVYRKVGFVEEGVRRRAIRYTDGRYTDEVMMSLWVGPSEEVESGQRKVGTA